VSIEDSLWEKLFFFLYLSVSLLFFNISMDISELASRLLFYYEKKSQREIFTEQNVSFKREFPTFFPQRVFRFYEQYHL